MGLLETIPQTSLTYTPGTPGFETHVAQSLGSVKPNFDGLDSYFHSFADSAPEVESLLKETGSLQAGMDADLAGLAGADFAPVDQALSNLITTTDNGVNSLDNTLKAAPGTPALPSDPTLSQAPVVAQSIGPTILKDLAGVLKDLGQIGELIGSAVLKILAVIPVWGWILAGIGTLAAILFHGADPNQVPAAKTEQVFERASNGFIKLFRAGMLSKDTTLHLFAGMIAGMTQAETQLEQRYGEVKPFSNAILNATHVINNLAAEVTAAPLPLPRPLDLNVALALFDSMPSAGWYVDSIQEARQIFTQVIQGLKENT